MFKQNLTLLSIITLFSTGCVERGYKEISIKVTDNKIIQKQAQSVVSKRSLSNVSQDILKSMQDLHLTERRIRKENVDKKKKVALRKREVAKMKLAEEIRLKHIQEKQHIEAKQKQAEKLIEKKDEVKKVSIKKKPVKKIILFESEKKKPENYTKAVNVSLSDTKELTFKEVDKTYHKFGTSEIHGHVIYLSKMGLETKLESPKIYLLPVTDILNYWYDNYYIKNKTDSSVHATLVEYANKTDLDVENNFSFFGVAKGTYFVIIESTYPENMGKKQKVYIAKKITVDKYKKIMSVFSKKL